MTADNKKSQNLKILEQYAKRCETKIKKSTEEDSANVFSKK
jgi:hypothetical protein